MRSTLHSAAVALLVFLAVKYLDAQTRGSGVVGFEWPTTETQARSSNHLPRDVVEHAVRLLQDKGSPPLTVGDFRFVPLEPGSMCLVATVDSSGRDLYFYVAVVCPVAGGTKLNLIESAPPHLLAEELIDFTGSGYFDLVSREQVGPYEGASTLPVYWYKIYSVRNSILTDVSGAHPDFYRVRVLPQVLLLSELLSKAGPDVLIEKARAENAYVNFKFDRVFQHEPLAGLDLALEWARSTDRTIRLLAVSTLAEIGSPETTSALTELGRDRDIVVAQAAANALTVRTKN